MLVSVIESEMNDLFSPLSFPFHLRHCSFLRQFEMD